MSTTIRATVPPTKYQSLLETSMPKLRMLPAVALEALELVKHPHCTVIEFSSIVERDAILASSMLRMANSPVYSPRRTISNLNQAVVRIGFQECRHLIMSSCVATLTKKLDFQEEWIRDLLWRHSLYTGTIAHHINRAFNCGFRGEEFTAGLLHDFGRTLFASLFSEEFLSIDPLNFEEREDPTIKESEKLGISHVEFAELYGQFSNLPDELTAVMRWHHAPHKVESNQKLVALIAVADDMANHLQCHGDAEGYEALENPFLQTFAESGGIESTQRFAEFAETIIEEAASDMHSSNAL